MRFELSEYHRNISDGELIEDLKKVAALLGKTSVTIEEYNEYGRYHATTLTRRFKSWFNCLERAGLQKSRSYIGITDLELFADIERVWIKLGKQPSYAQMRDLTQFSIGTYEKRFGGWQNALKFFVHHINESEEANLAEESVNEQDASVHRTSRTVNLRLRFLVMQRDKFKCCMCGASPAKDSSIILHVDHIIPWSRGGETVEGNLQTLCSKCNIGKSNL